MVSSKGETLPQIGLSDIQATDIYWEMIQAPRTGGVMIGKSLLTTKGLQTYTFEWALKGGQLVPRFRPERAEPFRPLSQVTSGKSTVQMFKPAKMGPYTPIYERGLTPFVSQQQLTRMGIYPTAKAATPTAGEITKKALGTTLASLAVASALKMGLPELAKPKLEEYMPTLAREREKFKPIMVQQMEQEQKKQALLVPKLELKQLQVLRQRLKSIFAPRRLERKRELVLPRLQRAQLPALAQPTRQKLILAPKVTPLQRQEQMQQLKPLTVPPMLKPSYAPYTPPPFPLSDVTGLQRMSMRGSRFGAWFYRRHPIAKPQDVMSLIGRGKATRSPASTFNKRMSQLQFRSNGTRKGKIRGKKLRSPFKSFEKRVRSII